jgi:hypothetical protein
MIEVGTVFVPVPAAKDRLLVRPIVRACPVGTVITTGDHPGTAGVVAVAATATGAFGFRGAQVAVETTPTASAPQV